MCSDQTNVDYEVWSREFGMIAEFKEIEDTRDFINECENDASRRGMKLPNLYIMKATLIRERVGRIE